MPYNTKNYTEQGGDKTVIGGELEFREGAQITGLNTVVPKAAYQAASSATTVAALKDDFNALLEKLKAAGLVEEEE